MGFLNSLKSIFNSDEADALIEKARLGNADASWKLAQMYMQGEGVVSSQMEAIKYATLAANLGHKVARNWLLSMGDIYGIDTSKKR